MQLPILEQCDRQFQSKEFGTISQLVRDLGKGSDPVAIMLTCSELGYEPDQLSHANSGELIVIQTAGGLIHPDDASDSVDSTLEYLGVQHLIVCGHSECKVFDLLLKPQPQRPKLIIQEMLSNVDGRFRRVYADRPRSEHRLLLIQESVLSAAGANSTTSRSSTSSPEGASKTSCMGTRRRNVNDRSFRRRIRSVHRLT